MIINCKTFRDLGKCSMGTLLNIFDTDKDHVLLSVDGDIVEVKISSIEDLSKFLWCVPGIAMCSKDEHTWIFSSIKPWWSIEFGEAENHCVKDIDSISKRINKSTSESNKKRLSDNLEYTSNLLSRFKERENALNDEMKNIIEELKNENK